MLTDLFQITMNAVYLDNDKDDTATFDLFVRSLPEEWGYFIAAGVDEAIDTLKGFPHEVSSAATAQCWTR